mgnify:FL=1
MSQNIKQRIITEIDRELDKRKKTYPNMILDKKLTRENANLYFLRLKAVQQYFETGAIGNIHLPDMMTELKRELAMRHAYYKAQIAKDRMDAVTAATKIMLMQEAVNLLSADMCVNIPKQGELF